MTKEEIIQAAQKESAYQLDIGSNAPLSIQEGFIKGAEWMQERMIDNPDGGALLYAVVKTAEKTKREMIEKAVNWLDEQMYFRDFSSGRGSYGEVKAFGGYDSLEEFIDEFKQAMENESK